VRGWGDAISKHWAEGLLPVAILLFLPITKRMIFCFFSLVFQHLVILMTDLLLNNFLHLLMYDAAQTNAQVVQYKKQQQQHNAAWAFSS
jgi:hypothetical protein